MKLSKYIAVCAIALWSAGAQAAITVAGVEFDETKYPKTAALMPEFIKIFQGHLDVFLPVLEKKLELVTEARSVAFPNDDLVSALRDFYEDNFEKLKTGEKPDVKGWVGLPSPIVFEKFNLFINDLEIAKRLLSKMPETLVGLAQIFESQANAAKKMPNYEDIKKNLSETTWFLARISSDAEEQNFMATRARFGEHPERIFLVPFCIDPNVPLRDFLKEKGHNPTEFWEENNIFSGTLSWFFTYKLCDPFVECLKKIVK